MLTAEQLDQRRSYLGGSDIGAVLGVNKYKTPMRLYLEKRGEIDDDVAGQAAEWGNRLEPVVASKYAENNSCKVERVNRHLTHPKYPFAAANLDRVACQLGTIPVDRRTTKLREGSWLVEIKTANQFTQHLWGEELTDELPDSYIAQCCWYIEITGAERCDVAVLIGGQQYREYQVTRDDELIAVMFEKAAAFWNDHVLAGVPPEPVCREDVALLHGESAARTVMATPEVVDARERLVRVKAQTKALKEEQGSLETILAKGFGEADTLVDINGQPLATWKTQTTNRLDTKGFREAHPDLAKQFNKPSTSRVLRIK